MPLDLPGVINRSEHSSGSTQRADSLKDSSGNILKTADRRRSSSYGRVSLCWNIALAGSLTCHLRLEVGSRMLCPDPLSKRSDTALRSQHPLLVHGVKMLWSIHPFLVWLPLWPQVF